MIDLISPCKPTPVPLANSRKLPIQPLTQIDKSFD